MSQKSVVKINFHDFFSDEAFLNGNLSVIGVVFRNIKGLILSMFGGSLCKEDRKNNEYHVFMEGLKEAYEKSTRMSFFKHIIWKLIGFGGSRE